MQSLGFDSVYNKNEDFYATQASKATPDFDCLVTNPPFSGDHIERLLAFCHSSKKPWAILMPQYVSKKGYYLEWVHKKRASKPANAFAVLSGAKVESSWPKPHFLGPELQPYVFEAPALREDVRQMREVGAEGLPLESLSLDEPPSHLTQAGSLSKGGQAGSSSKGGKDDGADHSASIIPSSPPTILPQEHGSSSSQPHEPSQSTTSDAFMVNAGSFQCIWFLNFGPKHHAPVMEWYENRVQSDENNSEAMVDRAVLASDVAMLPQLTAIHKTTKAPDLKGGKRADLV